MELVGAGAVAAQWGLAGTAQAEAEADPVADVYYRVLLRHTRWSETQFDAVAGHYRRTDFGFAVVLGNAVLVTRGSYDAQAAGVGRDELRARTVATIRHFAASNVLAGGAEWGKTLFWDTTFQSYFVLAARLLWTDLDATTRSTVDSVVRAQADYTTSLGTGDDPRSGAWTPNGLLGGFQGDTKLEEMGVYAQSLAPALAWADPVPEAWRAAFGRWSRNMAGLPAADLANPALVDGVAVTANTAANLHGTFLVENHGSFGPHYQEELWRTSARNAIHFLVAGRPLPEVITAQPNGERLWRSVLAMMSDAGEPLMPMVGDREHLYGRDVIPLAFRAQVLGDRHAARAEADLAARLEAYQAYPPADRMAKFSGEPKYEPEARAEIAIAYLLHELRPRPVPVDSVELFRFAAGATDFGAGPGLLAHQSERAWAATVSKAGLVKFAWQPGHDDWLFVISGATPMFLPSTGLVVRERFAAAYRKVRDGFDATASVLTFDSGRAGMVTLPTGTVVYATSGVAAGEGRVSVHNLTMPGVPGLDGDRRYTAAEGSATVRAAEGVGRSDDLVFPRTSARHVRMTGVTPHPVYGYSLFAVEVRDGASGTDLARGKAASASSFDVGRDPGFATDGDAGTRWAVAKAERSRADSWLAVDLGAVVPLDRARLWWETAAGSAYRLEVSVDGTRWTTAGAYPRDDLRSTGKWLDVDGRAGFVVHGAASPIAVRGGAVTLSDGPAAGFVVEGYSGGDRDLAAIAAAGTPVCPDGVRGSAADGYLSLFNLTPGRVAGVVSVRRPRAEVPLYQGTQRVTATGTEHDVALEAGTARVEPPRFTVRAALGGPVPVGVVATVVDGQRVRVSGTTAALVVAQAGGAELPVTGGEVVFPTGRPYPLDDLAVGRVTFPTSPLPAGMSDPAAAVDDSPATAWTPGPGGRMVVDLGAVVAVGEVVLTWTAGVAPTATVATSVDGRAYSPAAGGRRASVAARYLAVSTGWRTGQAGLVSVVVRPG